MLIDHVGAYFYPENIWMRIPGRFVFILLAYQMAIGADKTKSMYGYLSRVIGIALVAQIPFSTLSQEDAGLNAMFTLFLGLLSIHLYRERLFHWLWLPPLAAVLCNAEYNYYGVFLIFGMWYLKDNLEWKGWYMFATTLFFGVLHPLQWFSMFIIPMVSKQTWPRWFRLLDINVSPLVFYWFYPIHLAILAAIKKLLGGM